MTGLAITVVIISALNQTGPENFDGMYLHEEEQDYEVDETPTEDKEMMEKKLMTPISSYNIVPIVEPETFEPDAFSGVEPFSAF